MADDKIQRFEGQVSVTSAPFTEAMRPRTHQEAMGFCEGISMTEMVPTSFRGKKYAVLLAIMRGEKLGLDAFTSLQNIAIVNGRPMVYGNAPLALVQRSAAYEWHREDDIGAIQKAQKATCTVKRKGAEPYTSTFTVEMAKVAKLWERRGRNGEPTPWVLYPWRMLQLKARHYALENQFAAELEGLTVGDAEHASDDNVRDVQTGRPAMRPEADKIVDADGEPPTLNSILQKISAAQNSTQLEAVAEVVKMLSADDIAVAREHFIQRRKELVADAPEPKSKARKLKERMRQEEPKNESPPPKDWEEARQQERSEHDDLFK